MTAAFLAAVYCATGLILGVALYAYLVKMRVHQPQGHQATKPMIALLCVVVGLGWLAMIFLGITYVCSPKIRDTIHHLINGDDR